MAYKVCDGYCGNGNQIVYRPCFDQVVRPVYNRQDRPCLHAGRPCKDCTAGKVTNCNYAVCDRCRLILTSKIHAANAIRLESVGSAWAHVQADLARATAAQAGCVWIPAEEE